MNLFQAQVKIPGSTHRISRTSVIRHLPAKRLQKSALIRLVVRHSERKQPLFQFVVIPENEAENLLALVRLLDVYDSLDRTQRHQLDVFVRLRCGLLVQAVDGVGRLDRVKCFRPFLANFQLIGEEKKD